MASDVEVTQADRDRAANYLREVWGLDSLPDRIRLGEKDGNATVRAFAGHRLAALKGAEHHG